MKLNGMAGTGSGKLGSQVYASVAGEQVVRVYQPKVSNPNTLKQVNQRGRMKLMSQISAAMASVIVIPRVGMKSSRNLFSKKNFALTNAVNGQAVAFLENFQLTNGNASLPRVRMERVIDNKLEVSLMNSALGQVDRVVYNIFARSEEGDIMLVRSAVVEDAGQDGTFNATLEDYNADLYIYAYGMKDLGAKAKAKYGNYNVTSGEDVAKLLMSRTLAASDYQLTTTSGNSISVDETTTVDVGEDEVLIRQIIMGDGVVRNNSEAGAVVAKTLTKTRGSRLKWYAVPAPGYKFSDWQAEDDKWTRYVQNPITFTAWSDVNMIVTFINPTAGTGDGGME